MKIVESARLTRPLAIFVIVSVAIASGSFVSAQTTSPQSLKDVAIPKPDNLGEFVKDETALTKLGKAFFWDVNIGSDNKTSCATCHFHAGADNRSKNQINPGTLAELKDTTFQVGGPNYQLAQADFPFHKLVDPLKPITDGENGEGGSNVERTTNDVASSQGVFKTKFVKIKRNDREKVEVVNDDVFNVNGINTRRVEPRNTPTVINAVFNKFQFWDGRAKDIFNGKDISGSDDAYVYQKTANGLEKVKIQLENSSLASQAVGPPLSSIEMSSEGRELHNVGDKIVQRKKRRKRWRKRGKKLRMLRPLGKQLVAADDSVLGSDSRFPANGLKQKSYEQLIKKAFRNKWWKSGNYIIREDEETGETEVVRQPGGPKKNNEYTLMEHNFSLFFGLAVQEYESTLVSDETPFDKFMEGDTSAMSQAQQRGMALFNNNLCNACHVAPEFTIASVRLSNGSLQNFDGGGFFRIGVTKPTDDLGSDGAGSFKSSGLRNIELTAPYMHDGGLLSLEQVVEFYARGGNFGSGLPNTGLLVLDGRIVTNPLGTLKTDNLLNGSEGAQNRADLVAFLKALTDERVRYEKAPFDHPSLRVPNGHKGDENSVTDRGNGTAKDKMTKIPAVGRNGRSTPPPNFLDNPPKI
ncbi:MAG: cytochrome c peroxidase [Calothrix sp. MO_167.B42]|nr:cytochrome c peroxidase [Calothrix sp. MO_167.B42]